MLSKSLCGCHLLELSYMYILHHRATLLNKLHRTGSFWAADDASAEAQIAPCKRIVENIGKSWSRPVASFAVQQHATTDQTIEIYRNT